MEGHTSISHDPSEDNIPSHLLIRSLQLLKNIGNIICGAVRVNHVAYKPNIEDDITMCGKTIPQEN
jgi:hypothetical protein